MFYWFADLGFGISELPTDLERHGCWASGKFCQMARGDGSLCAAMLVLLMRILKSQEGRQDWEFQAAMDRLTRSDNGVDVDGRGYVGSTVGRGEVGRYIPRTFAMTKRGERSRRLTSPAAARRRMKSPKDAPGPQSTGEPESSASGCVVVETSPTDWMTKEWAKCTSHTQTTSSSPPQLN